MASFIEIPRRYDVATSGIDNLDVICTGHSIPRVLRRIEHGFVGVDEIILLIENHEREHHDGDSKQVPRKRKGTKSTHR